MGRASLSSIRGANAPVRRGLALAGMALAAAMLAAALASRNGIDVRFLVLAAVSAMLWLVVVRQWARSERVLKQTRLAQAVDSAQFEKLFFGSELGLAILDQDGVMLRVNPALARMFGATGSGPGGVLVGRTVRGLTHPDDRPLTDRHLALLRGATAGYAYEKRFVGLDGRLFHAHVTVSKTVNEHTGRPLIFEQVQDITERKRIELELAEERHLFDEFLAHIPAQVYFKDRESRFLRVSAAQAARFGLEEASELIGRTDFDVFDEEHAASARADELRIMETGQPLVDAEEEEVYGEGSGEILRGERRWVATTKLPLRDVRGEVIGTFGISRDITVKKRAEAALSENEARWRVLLEHLQEIVLLVDDERRLKYAAPSLKRWLGYEPDEVLGVDLLDGIHRDDAPALLEAFEQVTPDRPRSVTHRVRHRDGSWHTLESTLVCMRDNPIVQAVLVAVMDVTDQIRLEEERERLDFERRVSHRLEAVGQLAAGIAHEINTPLQFVGDSVTFLGEAVEELLRLSGRYRELLWQEQQIGLEQRRTIMTEAEAEADLEYLRERIPLAFARTADGISRVRSIVQAMKRFSHPSSGEIVSEDINEAIETTLAVCRNEYKYVAEVALELGELPPVPCNIGEINQVLLNLIVNAAQAIEEQRAGRGAGAEEPLGLITISTRLDGDRVLIKIADDGPGIPLELQERIYEPFFTTKEVGKGTGQGLALVRTTIDRHGGSLECTSAPGEGTIFTILLPLQPAAADAAPDPDAAPVATEPNIAFG